MAGEVVGDARIEGAGTLRPLVEEGVHLFERHEQVLGRPHLRACAGERADGVDKVGRRVGRAALFTRVAVLVGRLAAGARAADEPVSEKDAGLGVVELLHVARGDQAAIPQAPPDDTAQPAVGVTVGGAVMIEADLEATEIGEVCLPHRGDQCMLAAALGLGPDHDRSAVRVVGAEINGLVATQLLEPHEDIGLDVLDQVPQMDVPVGVGQGGGDENTADAVGHAGFLEMSQGKRNGDCMSVRGKRGNRAKNRWNRKATGRL